MIHSFNSWSNLTEAIATGKDVLVDSSGKRHKVVYRVQDSTTFILKMINEPDIIDANDRITSNGLTAIKNYLNEEPAFTSTVGQLTPDFFKNQFIVYTILRDGQIFGRTKQKIQFKVEQRFNPDGSPKYANIPVNAQFVDSNTFASAETILAPPVVQKIVDTAKKTELPDPEPIQKETEKEVTPTPNQETAAEKARKFLYTMRTNNKLYLMEFAADGTLTAKTKDGSDPNGMVSYDSAGKRVLWNTTLDDEKSKDVKVAKEKGAPLFYDMEITQSQDKAFLEKMFTDAEFRKKILAEYEREYGASELTPENLRRMLFYKDGTAIFPSAAQSSTATAATSTAAQDAEAIKKQQAEFIASLKTLQQSTTQPVNLENK